MDDEAKYIGFPVWKTCIFLNVASCSMYIFVLFYLPFSIAFSLMAVELAVGIIGLLASLSSHRCLAKIYLVVQTIMIVPAVISFCNLFVIYNDYDEMISVCWSWRDCTKNLQKNVKRIVNTHQRVVIAAMVCAVIGTILVIISFIGFRKLRRFQGQVVSEFHRTQIMQNPHRKASAPPNMMPSMNSNKDMKAPIVPEPINNIDPQRYNVVYQPYGYQEQFHNLAQPHAQPMEPSHAPPAYVNVYPTLGDHPPGYIP